MAKNNNKDKEIDKSIISNIKDLGTSITDLSYKVQGSKSNEIGNSLDTKINALSNDLEINCNGDILGSLISITRDAKMEEYKKLEQIRATIKDNADNNIMQTLLNDMNSVVAKYEDLILITSLMPQLKDARKGIVANILSPDDATKKVSLSFSLYGQSILSTDENKEFYNEVKDIMDSVNYTKLLKHAIDRTVTLGRYYYAVLPYSELYGEMIAKNNKKNKKYRLKESEEFDNILTEASVNIADEEDFKLCLESSTNIELNKVKQNIANFVQNNVVINESSIGLFDEDILSEELKLAEAKSNSINKDGDNSQNFEKYAMNIFKNQNNRRTNYNSNDNGFYSTSTDIDDDDKPNIKGCKIKKLDPRRLIPLKVDDTCFGYYYIENKRSMKALQNPLKFKLKNDLNKSQIENSIDTIYRSIGELMATRLDKKFIEKNSEITDRLYDIIKNYEDAEQQYSITYLKPDDVVEFEIDDGESPFEQSLYFSKLYMLVLLSTITAKVTRSNDVRAYYVDVDAKGPANGMVANAINTLKRQNKSIVYYNNIQKILSANTVFDDIFLPKPAEGKNPIDYDIIQGQNVDIPTDLLEMLEKIAVDSTGLPLQLIQSSNDADFAKAYSMLNIKFLKRIVDFQVDLNPSTTLLLVKILLCYFEKDSDQYNKAKNLIVSLQSPINVQLSNSLEQINNAKEFATTVVEVRLGNSERYSDELREDLTLELVKKHTPNVDWNEIDDIILSLTNKHVAAKSINNDDSDDGSGDINMDEL